MAHDPIYGSEVDEGGGLFPTREIVLPYLDSPSTNAAPVTDNGDIRSSADDRDEDDLDPVLIDEDERSKPLHDLSQINARPVDLPPAPAV